MRINNVKRIILGLDRLTYGVKQNQLTFGTRFDYTVRRYKKAVTFVAAFFCLKRVRYSGFFCLVTVKAISKVRLLS